MNVLQRLSGFVQSFESFRVDVACEVGEYEIWEDASTDIVDFVVVPLR